MTLLQINRYNVDYHVMRNVFIVGDPESMLSLLIGNRWIHVFDSKRYFDSGIIYHKRILLRYKHNLKYSFCVQYEL